MGRFRVVRPRNISQEASVDSSVANDGLGGRIDKHFVLVNPYRFAGQCALSLTVRQVAFIGLWTRRVEFVCEASNCVAVIGLVNDVVVPVANVVVVGGRHASALYGGVAFDVFPALLWGRGHYEGVFTQRVNCFAGPYDTGAIFTVERLRFVVGLGDGETLYRQGPRSGRFIKIFNAFGEFVCHTRGREANDGCHGVRRSRRFRAFRADFRAYAVSASPLFKGGEYVYLYSSHCFHRRVKDDPEEAAGVHVDF